MNYPHGSLISFVTPLLFDACTDLSRLKRLVIIVCFFPHVLPQFIHVVLYFFLCVCICISMFFIFLFIDVTHLLFEVSCMYVCYLLFQINNNNNNNNMIVCTCFSKQYITFSFLSVACSM